MGTDLRAVRLTESEKKHPCLSCGACCASFRVSFYWREANPEDQSNAVPLGLTEDVTDSLRCMKGTNVNHHSKCIALKGRIGDQVACSIYENRSSTCKNFRASYENGKHNPRCDEARAKHGLPPLGHEDYISCQFIEPVGRSNV